MTVHLIRVALHAHAVLRLQRIFKLPNHVDQTSYLAHVALAELFQEAAPHPFFVEREDGPTLEILGYSKEDAGALRERAELSMKPEAHACLVGDSLVSRPMPTFAAGRKIGFRTRVMPVRRFARGSERAGQEVDAFLHACTKAGRDVPVDRNAVYQDWLREQFAAHGATVEEASMDGFRRVRPVRRTQTTGAPDGGGRRPHGLDRPEVHFSGVVTVTDGDAFQAGLARGLGRHRAFGYGMVLLQPAGR